jgi:hypothetical protein
MRRRIARTLPPGLDSSSLTDQMSGQRSTRNFTGTIDQERKLCVLITLVFFLEACAYLSSLKPAPAMTPTPTPSITAEPTLSPSPIPSTTPKPTLSPTSTPGILPEPVLSRTPNFVILQASPTPSASSGLDCTLDWQSPSYAAWFDPEESFSAGWKVTNTGTVTWNPGSVVFTYLDGAKLHRDPLVQLKASVAPGQSVVLTADMKAPTNSTTYTTYWGLRQGDTFFCRLTVSIYVR